MFVFGLRTTKVWATLALLLLCCSICPHSCYPYADDDDDPTGAKENLDNDEGHEQELDQDDDEEESLEEEQALQLNEAADVENAPTLSPDKDCQGWQKRCGMRDKCCRKKGEELKCDSNGMCVSDW